MWDQKQPQSLCVCLHLQMCVLLCAQHGVLLYTHVCVCVCV